MGNETGDDLFFWRSPHHRRDRGLDLRKSVPVFEREPIIDPKIWLHEMRPSTVPVFAFAKADTQMEVETADAPTVGVISKKKRVTLAYPRDVQPPYLAIIAVCNKRPSFAFTKNGHPT